VDLWEHSQDNKETAVESEMLTPPVRSYRITATAAAIQFMAVYGGAQDSPSSKESPRVLKSLILRIMDHSKHGLGHNTYEAHS